MHPDTKIAIFRGRKIMKMLYNNEWWVSVADVCEALTDSIDAGAYWRKLKQRLQEEGSEVVTFCHGLATLKKRLKRSIVSAHNYLKQKESQKRLADV